MTELIALNFFLCFGFVLAPVMTEKFLLSGSKVYSNVHKISLIVLLVAVVFNFDSLAFTWPLFCAFGSFLYIKSEYKSLFSIEGLAGGIPFVFSLISSVWYAAGVNDLHLLCYSKTWSFYAALHGMFLGWLFIGCLAFLAKRPKASKVYLWGCYLCFVFFLFVAFGIDGTPYLKRLGVVALSLIAPFLIGHYRFRLKPEHKASRCFAGLSLFSIMVAMALAILNEFWQIDPQIAFGIPVMVLAHGFLNAMVTLPCFFLAIRFERLDAR